VKYRLLDLLRCPDCGQRLRLIPFVESKNGLLDFREHDRQPRCRDYCGLHQATLNDLGVRNDGQPPNCQECYRNEVVDGLLICQCAAIYPIIAKVPRLVQSGLEPYPEFREKFRDKLEEALGVLTEQDCQGAQNQANEFEAVRRSFSQEWSFYDYERDKIWGWELKERKEVFLNEIGIAPDDLKGKLMLDAGCGNGALTAVLAEFDMEIFGFDLSESVSRAESNKSKFAASRGGFVHFVQGNLINPPLAEEYFDLIYSSGVLHHTPDTKTTFMKITPLLKKGGRVFVWVYGMRSLVVRIFAWHGRFLAKYLALNKLLIYCRLLSPFYKIAAMILSALGISEFRKRSLREFTLDLFDAFSPRYNHRHEKGEVCDWFAESNFKNVEVAGVSKHGFGVRGDRA
jgi:SAM-dependent methyltransferase/uncharacterized protein YbaR (Trm112 family)